MYGIHISYLAKVTAPDFHRISLGEVERIYDKLKSGDYIGNRVDLRLPLSIMCRKGYLPLFAGVKHNVDYLYHIISLFINSLRPLKKIFGVSVRAVFKRRIFGSSSCVL